MTWLPTPAQVGVHSVEITLQSPAGSDVQRFSVGVICLNPTPLTVGCGCQSAYPFLLGSLALLPLCGRLRAKRRARRVTC